MFSYKIGTFLVTLWVVGSCKLQLKQFPTQSLQPIRELNQQERPSLLQLQAHLQRYSIDQREARKIIITIYGAILKPVVGVEESQSPHFKFKQRQTLKSQVPIPLVTTILIACCYSNIRGPSDIWSLTILKAVMLQYLKISTSSLVIPQLTRRSMEGIVAVLYNFK